MSSLTANPGFRPNEGVSRERGDTVIPGEPPSRGGKPVRILNNFTFFSREGDVFAELDDLAHDGYNSTIEGVGEVLAVRGEEMPDEDEDVDEPILLRLTPIVNASIDYEKHNECVLFIYVVELGFSQLLALFTLRRDTPGTDLVYPPLNISPSMSNSTCSTAWPRSLFQACLLLTPRPRPISLLVPPIWIIQSLGGSLVFGT